MAEKGSKGGSAAATLSVPAILAAMLAMLGVSNRPEPKPATAAATAAPAADPLASASGDSRLEAIYRSHRLRADDPSAMLDLLEPLARFYGPRIAREPSLGSGSPGKSLDARKVVDWMLDPARTGDDLRTMIAMVPDPVRSGSPYRYDNTITGLTVAMSRCGFLLDGTKVAWRPSAARRPAAAPGAPAPVAPAPSAPAVDPNAPPDPASERPGVVLFRRPVLGRADGKADKHELVLVLMVAETPIRGVHSGMLQTSLDLAARVAQIRGKSDRPTLRVVGPCFTGSQSSLARAIRSWLQDPQRQGEAPRIDLHNGVSIGVDPGKLAASCSRPGRDDVRVRNVIYGADDLNNALYDYLEAHARPLAGNKRIALVTEESTALGRTLRQGAGSSTTVGGFELFPFTFPLHIGEMRRRYGRDDGGADQAVGLKAAERLRIDLDEGPGNAEILPAEDPAFSATYDESRLFRVADEINRRGIRFIWVTATDQRDRLFVTELLRNHCPDAQLIGLSNDPSFTHRQRIAHFRGMLFASTYPMWSDGRDGQFQALPEHTSYGSHNAVVAHLADMFPTTPEDDRGYENRLLAYAWPGVALPDRPPIWITAASQQGLMPLHVFLPSAAAPKEAGSGKFAATLWRPAGKKDAAPSSSWREFGYDLRLLFGRVVAITSGVSPTLPILFAVFGTAAAAFCSARTAKIRGMLGLQDHFPLPLPPGGKKASAGGEKRGAAPPAYLVTTAETARLLGEEADPLRSRLYGHKGLIVLALGGFAGSVVFLWWAGRRLPTAAGFIGLFLMVVVAACVAHGSRKLRAPSRDLRASRLWPRAIAITLGLSVVWSILKLVEGLPTARFDPVDLDLLLVFLCGAGGVAGLVMLWMLSLGKTRHGAGRAMAPGEGRVGLPVVFAVLVGAAGLAFLVVAMATIESFSIMALVLMLVVAALFLAVLHASMQIRAYWERLADLTDSILSLPLGPVIDRLPNRLTSRMGSYKEALEGSSDRELADRLEHIRGALALCLDRDAAHPPSGGPRVPGADFRKAREALDNPNAACGDPGPLSARFLAAMLTPVWTSRGPDEAYPDQGSNPEPAPAELPAFLVEPPAPVLLSPPPPDLFSSAQADSAKTDAPASAEKPAEKAPAPPPPPASYTLSPRTLAMAENYVALEVVRFLNRHLDLLWLRVTALTILTLSLLMAVNSYPFQPASCLYHWVMVPVIVSIWMVLRVLIGVNKNELIARVNKDVADRSLLNLDFLSKIAAYIGPVVALLAALSVGVSDFFRILLGPFAS